MQPGEGQAARSSCRRLSSFLPFLFSLSFLQAGYMSGMLVPVAVGIAGALFILGALYSIKIMNRRRRNGFKRHRRKVGRSFQSLPSERGPPPSPAPVFAPKNVLPFHSN